MGKEKRKRMWLKKGKKDSIDFFISVFNHLIELHREREKFALNWIWNDSEILQVFLETVLGTKAGSRDLLMNGYHNCRKEEFDVFPPCTWEKIDDIFLNKRLLSDLPKPIRALLKILKSQSQSQLLELLIRNEAKMIDDTSFSHTWTEVRQVSKRALKKMSGCFLGEWTIPPEEIFEPELAKVCRIFPAECVYARNEGNLTYFYERIGDNVEIIAVHLRGALEQKTMHYLRNLLEDLFVSHPAIIRRSMATLDSHMTGFGPFWQRFQAGGGNKVSYHTHVEKLSSVLCSMPAARDFKLLVDRHAHTHLSEIILALYFWKLPMLVTSFLKFSKPYLEKAEYEMTCLERLIGGLRPCSYQLYITKDFCSEIHKDIDMSKFTLSYSSHPDGASTSPMQFVMAEHGFRIPVEDGSMFGFRSSVAHGTSYRNHTHNAAYMGCLVVNSARHALTRRQGRM